MRKHWTTRRQHTPTTFGREKKVHNLDAQRTRLRLVRMVTSDARWVASGWPASILLKTGLTLPYNLSQWNHETFRKRNSESLETNEEMPRYCRDTPNGKWLHDHGKKWRAVLSSYVSKSISSFASLAKKQHITKITKILVLSRWLRVSCAGAAAAGPQLTDYQ